ncbi:MAG: NAD(P)-binding oxidoreductase [Myxococcaceae bacterium]|nr:NAD(P)-binding oxidoreductase [Myxococcaceae bacterium]
MRLAVLGAGGRTGRLVVALARARGHAVVALSRKPLVVPEGVEVQQGDALDVEAVTRLLRGCDAVVCAIGPTPGAPKDQDSRLAPVLIEAMGTSGLRRLALITGAMQAEPKHLGAFYRRVTQAESVRVLLDDRRQLEQRLLGSGLEVTILRPPRLSARGPSLDGPEVTDDARITLMDSCSREDLARALLDAVEPGARTGPVFVRSSPRDGAFWPAWLLRCGLAEFLGITLAAVAAVGLNWLVGEPDTTMERWLVYASFLLTGAAEGAFIGLGQGTLLKRLVPSLPLGTFVGATMLPAVLAWAVGMAPSTFFVEPSTTGAPMEEPSTWVVLLVSAAGGAVGGALIGAAQALALRRSVESVKGWVLATVLGWALALPLDLLGATLPDAATPGWLIASSAGGFGLLAGLTFAVPTGLAALGLRRRRQ